MKQCEHLDRALTAHGSRLVSIFAILHSGLSFPRKPIAKHNEGYADKPTKTSDNSNHCAGFDPMEPIQILLVATGAQQNAITKRGGVPLTLPQRRHYFFWFLLHARKLIGYYRGPLLD